MIAFIYDRMAIHIPLQEKRLPTKGSGTHLSPSKQSSRNDLMGLNG